MKSNSMRRSVANAIDDLDEQIVGLNGEKRDAYESYRDHLSTKGLSKGEIKSELESLRIAIRLRREWKKDADKVQHRDALVDEILLEIQGDESGGTKDALARAAHEALPPRGKLSLAANEEADPLAPGGFLHRARQTA